MRSLNRKLLRDLSSLKVQGITLSFLLISGVSLLVASWSAYNSLKNAQSGYYTNYGFAHVFAELKSAPRAQLSRLAEVAGVDRVEGRIVETGLINISTQTEPAVGKFISLPSDSRAGLNRLHLREGRMPESDSVIREMVVHAAFASAHRIRSGDRLKVQIRGKETELLISGIGISPETIYSIGPASPLPDDKHFGIFWLEGAVLEKMVDMTGAFNNVVATLQPNADSKLVIGAFNKQLETFGSRGAYGRDRQLSHAFISDEISQQKSTAIFAPTVFLGVAAFLINIVISRLVAVQRQQIAMLKAVGFFDREIIVHYIKLVVVVSSLGIFPGIYLGSLIGEWMASLYRSYYHFPSLDFSLDLTAVFVGIVAGLVPAFAGAFSSIRKAVVLPPAEAMRPPAPPKFARAFAFEGRWIKRVGVRGKVVFRNAILHRARLLMTVAGISLAISLVVMSGFWRDAVDLLMETQFQVVQREDISVDLMRPRPLSVLREISNLDGVIAVEGQRNVPARISYLHHRREVAISGRSDDSLMRKYADRSLTPVRPPPEGILLSRYFANKWGLKIGDRVLVESLEGRPRPTLMSVAGFTDETIGQSITMSTESLWRWLDENSAYNVILIQVDATKLEALYVLLKQRPEIGGVTVKTLMYRSLLKTFGSMVMNSVFVLMIFSTLTAIGVIYNGARVNFSERSRELASLQVLGFTPLETYFVFIGEAGLYVFLSLVPGCIAGWWLAKASVNLLNTEVFNFPIFIAPSTYGTAVATVLLAFAVSALIAWRMLKKLDIVESLKTID